MKNVKFKKYILDAGTNFRSLNSFGSGNGENTVAIDFNNKIIHEMSVVGGIASLATITYGPGETKTPTNNDSEEVGVLLSVAGELEEKEPEFDEGILYPKQMISSGLVKSSNEFVQDQDIDIEQWLAARFGTRIQRRESALIFKGTGLSVQPLGMNAAIKNVIDADSATELSVKEVENMVGSIDPVYRDHPTFALAFNDNTLKALRDEAASNYLLALELSAKKVAGHRFIIDNNISDIGAGNCSIFAGVWKNLLIKRSDIRFKVIREAFAELDQIGFVAVQKTDFLVADQKTFATIKH